MVTETVSPFTIASWVCCKVANTPNADNYRLGMDGYPTPASGSGRFSTNR